MTSLVSTAMVAVITSMFLDVLQQKVLIAHSWRNCKMKIIITDTAITCIVWVYVKNVCV